jgi:AraC-like DNA-binding protein
MTKGVTTTRGFVLRNLARCFAAEGGDAAAAFTSVGLRKPDQIADGDVLPSDYYYRLLNRMTEMSCNRMFPARAGRATARAGVSVLVDQRRASRTLGEFIIRCQIAFRKAVDSGWYVLRSDGKRATFEIEGRHVPAELFANVETLNAAAWITIFHDEIGDDFHTDLKATLPDPTAMPRDYLDPRSCFKSRDGRSKLSFPCDWLLVELKQEWSVPPSHVDGDLRQRDTTTELDPIRQAIAERLQVGEVKLEEVASWLGQSPRGLQRKLRENGQTLRKIVQQERTNRAAALLRESDMPINEIALMCGYSSAQSLARSFRSAFGLSPSEFRDQPREGTK